MKKYIYWLAMSIVSATLHASPMLSISDVQISPVQPSFTDLITIETDGSFSQGGNTFDYSVFSSDDYSLELDLYFTGGIGSHLPQPWFHNDEIGILSQGSYDLSVQAYWRVTDTADYVLHDAYSTNFEVVPEPASILLFGSVFIVVKKSTSLKKKRLVLPPTMTAKSQAA